MVILDFIEIDIDYRMDRIEASYLGALLNVGNSQQNVDSLYLIWALGCPPIGPQLRSKKYSWNEKFEFFKSRLVLLAALL